MYTNLKSNKLGFTIIELIVVVVVIGILAAVAVVGYGSWRNSVTTSAVKSDLTQVQTAMANARNFDSGYPTSIPTSFTPSDEVTVSYVSGDAKKYCVQAISVKIPSIVYHVNTEDGTEIQTGPCN